MWNIHQVEFCDSQVGVKAPKVTWYQTPQNKNIKYTSKLCTEYETLKPPHFRSSSGAALPVQLPAAE